MRRFSLGFGAPAGPPFTMGYFNLTPAGSEGNGRLWVAGVNPAPRAGTVTSVSFSSSGSGGSVYFLTGLLNTGAGTFTVRAVSGEHTIAADATGTFSVSLAVGDGEHIAVYAPSSGGANVGRIASSGTWLSGTGVSLPAEASVVSVTSIARGICLQATGA